MICDDAKVYDEAKTCQGVTIHRSSEIGRHNVIKGISEIINIKYD